MTKNSLARELATRLNKMINIPLINEEVEQAFFEMVVSMLLGLILDKLGLMDKLEG